MINPVTNMKSLRSRPDGFTIVELLIVIVVIAILAAITIVAFNGVQDRARTTKMKADIAMLQKAIQSARIAQSKVLVDVTSSNTTSWSCTQKPSGTNLATLPRTDNCWTSYSSGLAAISTASGINVNGLVDPWGRPYFIDENENDPAHNSDPCPYDVIGAFKYPFVSDDWNPLNQVNVPLYVSKSGC